MQLYLHFLAVVLSRRNIFLKKLSLFQLTPIFYLKSIPSLSIFLFLSENANLKKEVLGIINTKQCGWCWALSA